MGYAGVGPGSPSWGDGEDGVDWTLPPRLRLRTHRGLFAAEKSPSIVALCSFTLVHPRLLLFLHFGLRINLGRMLKDFPKEAYSMRHLLYHLLPLPCLTSSGHELLPSTGPRDAPTRLLCLRMPNILSHLQVLPRWPFHFSAQPAVDHRPGN